MQELVTKTVKRFTNSLSYFDLCIPTKLQLVRGIIKDLRWRGRLAFNMEYISESQPGCRAVHAGMVCDTVYVGRQRIKKHYEMREIRRSLEAYNPVKAGDNFTFIR